VGLVFDGWPGSQILTRTKLFCNGFEQSHSDLSTQKLEERCSERHNNTMGIQIEAQLAAGAYRGHMAEQIDKTADKTAALILSATDVPTASCVQLVLQCVAVSCRVS